MKKTITLTSFVAILTVFMIGLSTTTQAKTEIMFEKPEKFMDFRTRNVLSTIDRERLTADLSKNIDSLVQKTLPANQSMQITFTDIDMTGNIFPGPDEIRTVSNITDRTLLKFDYEIIDENGKSIKKGSEKLVNMYFNNAMTREARKFRQSRFKNELVLFSRWLRKL